MRKILLVLLSLVMLAPQSYSASQLLKAGTAVAYVGPGDVPNATFTIWCGLRAFSQATVSTKAIRVIRASDSAQSDINSLANGTLDVATATTFCNATTCTVSKCYDKVGTRDMLGTNATLTFNCLNTSLPCIQAVNSNSNGAGGAGWTPARGTPADFSFVANRSSGTSAQVNYYVESGSAGNRIRGGGANQTVLVGASSGSITATMSDATFHAVNAVINGASSVVNVDGVETTGTVVGASTTGGTGWNAGTSTTTQWCEGGVSDDATAWNSTVRAAISANQKAYWGTP